MELQVGEKGERLDKFLAERAKVRSRSAWQKAIQGGAVKVNGHFVTKQGFTLRSGDRVVILEEKLLAAKGELVVKPEPDLPLTVIYEDADIVGVSKPAGMLVHPTLTKPRHTLVNVLLARYPEMATVGESPLRPGIVHRLDQDTSGVLVAARNQTAFEYLKKQFLDRRVKKTYLALVVGVPKEREGVIDYAIRPTAANRLKKVAVRSRINADSTRTNAEGKQSVRDATTRYKVIEQFGDRYALLEVMPETGRTHQIRVHLKAIGHPVAGDRLYAQKSDKRQAISDRGLGLKRQFLHAYRLELTAPSGKPLTLTAELPEELRETLIGLRRHTGDGS